MDKSRERKKRGSDSKRKRDSKQRGKRRRRIANGGSHYLLAVLCGQLAATGHIGKLGVVVETKRSGVGRRKDVVENVKVVLACNSDRIAH